jgi:hypothetical protein
LIIRGVTDLVSENCGEAYGNIGLFAEGSKVVMKALLDIINREILSLL